MTNGDDPETEALLRRAGSGDDTARQDLLERHRNRLRQMISVRLDPRIAARLDPSDVVQETLAEASRRLDDFLAERPLPFFPWLRRLAGDRLVEAYRAHVVARKRAVDREIPLGQVFADASTACLAHRLVDAGGSPSALVRREEQIRLLCEVLSQLTENDREVLVMRYLEHLRFGEIAAVLGITENAVKVRHFRAVERLRASMARLGSGEHSQ
ncbi:sigma-70 family RNA polymerase sigma factor [Tautonia marina]|uniref:sigma-70 family RNA polymerase sigma factor n=1 Tax=Tautonia marina TaxID=2653855 RepID=UPI0012605DEA|nr:sigma-70 family RNA polymerase sigma factor [Tautonia marina]